MPRYALTIEFDTAAALAAFADGMALAASARGSPPREPDDDEAPHPPKPHPPRAANGTAAGPMTGGQLLDWVNGHPDKQAALKRVQSAGKRLGYGWQVKMWKPQQVADVVREMAAHGRGVKT